MTAALAPAPAVVLMFGDDPHTVQQVEQVSEDLGIACLRADDVGEAVRLISERRPALVVVDHHLTASDGLRLIECARSAYPESKALFHVQPAEPDARVSASVRVLLVAADGASEAPALHMSSLVTARPSFLC